jgi:hypothetical protein
MTAITAPAKTSPSRLWRVRQGFGTLPYVQFPNRQDRKDALLVMVVATEHGPVRVGLSDGQCRSMLKHLVDVLGKTRRRQ